MQIWETIGGTQLKMTYKCHCASPNGSLGTKVQYVEKVNDFFQLQVPSIQNCHFLMKKSTKFRALDDIV